MVHCIVPSLLFSLFYPPPPPLPPPPPPPPPLPPPLPPPSSSSSSSSSPLLFREHGGTGLSSTVPLMFSSTPQGCSFICSHVPNTFLCSVSVDRQTHSFPSTANQCLLPDDLNGLQPICDHKVVDFRTTLFSDFYS